METVRWAVGQAVLAPSLLNSQPWRFRVAVDRREGTARLELYLDRQRAVPHLDPTGREGVLACGAALLNLVLALRAAGRGSTVRLLPDHAAPHLLAVVTVRGTVRERPEERPLREAIPLRTTCRSAFEPGPLVDSLLDHLVAAAAYEGALATVLDEAEAREVRALAAASRVRSAQDAGHAQDCAAWARQNLEEADDGVPGWVHGLGLVPSLEEPHRLRRGTSTVAAREAHAEGTTAGRLLVVGAPSDERPAVLRAGAGLERLLLAATAAGAAAGFLDETLRFADARAEVGRLAGLDHPQVVVRLGYARSRPPTRRRPVDDVLSFCDL